MQHSNRKIMWNGYTAVTLYALWLRTITNNIMVQCIQNVCHAQHTKSQFITSFKDNLILCSLFARFKKIKLSLYVSWINANTLQYTCIEYQCSKSHNFRLIKHDFQFSFGHNYAIIKLNNFCATNMNIEHTYKTHKFP